MLPSDGASELDYDVLVIDLDGTLLAADGSVSRENIDAIDAARTAGLEVLIATGRALVESQRPLDAIGHTGPVITAGGSMLCCGATGRTLSRSVMMPDLVVEITSVLLEHDHKVLLLKDADETGYDYLVVGSADLDPASQWWFESLPVRLRFVHGVDEDPDPHHTVRVGIVAEGRELGPLARHLQETFGDRAFMQHWPAVTATKEANSTTHLLEVFTPDVDKWTMISVFCADRGVDTARVVAIGDGLNDVMMVREAGLGVAMANADDGVRAVADRVTLHHGESGVAHAIRMVLGGEW